MVKIPYADGFLSYEFKNAAVIASGIDKLKSQSRGGDIVREAMRNPIAAPRLFELAKGKQRCTIIISDHTRPVPSKDILPPILEELRMGNPDIDIILLVATGFHRETTSEELISKLGYDLYNSEKIVVHDSRSDEDNVYIGMLPSGAPCKINRLAIETDLLVAEGFIEPHFFAGFSGGRKSVLPGVSDQATVLGNHCSNFIHSDKARTGIMDDNPIHQDMLAAAKMAGLTFIVNVVIDENKNTVAAFAGDYVEAHKKGCDFLREYCEVAAIPADIVVTSNGGAPLDQNVYQCVKGLTAAEATAKPGAVLIMCAGLADGHGGEGFYNSLKNCETIQGLYSSIMATPWNETIPDQWETQILARILKKHKVIFVAPKEREQLLREMKMEYAASLDEAISVAVDECGKDASVTVIPNGVSIIIK